jgi:histidine kinase family protein
MVRSRPGKLLISVGVALILAIAAAASWQILATRERAIADNARELDNVSRILVEQTERTLEGIFLLQDSILEYARARGATSPQQFEAEMETLATHRMLLSKVTGLPYLDTVSVLNAEGRLLNFTRYWPIPWLDFPDRSYFKALSQPGVDWFLSEPLQNRATGTWTVYLARKVRGPSGEMIGVILGAFSPTYFEKAFASLALEGDTSIALFRLDGVLLARHPLALASIGGSFSSRANWQRLAQGEGVTPFRSISSIDGIDRIFAGRKLGKFPAMIVVATSTASVLAEWRAQSVFFALAGAVGSVAVAVSFMLVLRELNRWRIRGCSSTPRSITWRKACACSMPMPAWWSATSASWTCSMSLPTPQGRA